MLDISVTSILSLIVDYRDSANKSVFKFFVYRNLVISLEDEI